MPALWAPDTRLGRDHVPPVPLLAAPLIQKMHRYSSIPTFPEAAAGGGGQSGHPQAPISPNSMWALLRQGQSCWFGASLRGSPVLGGDATPMSFS